jgi:hypothetical protein
MKQQDILLSINPYHLELIKPLIKWKIMSIKEVFEDSGYPSSYKGFHKIIQRLEKHGVIRGFKDVWTKTKRIYLTFEGNSLISPHGHVGHVYNDQNIFHDSRVALYLRFLAQNYDLAALSLEHEELEIKYKESFQRIRPDARFQIEVDSVKINFLLEIELTQKTKDRAWEKIAHYKDEKRFRFVIFVFPTLSIYKSYLSLLKTNADLIGHHNYIFVMDEGLIRGTPSLNSLAFFQNKETTLQNVMTEIMGRSAGDFETTLDRLWGKQLKRFS